MSRDQFATERKVGHAESAAGVIRQARRPDWQRHSPHPSRSIVRLASRCLSGGVEGEGILAHRLAVYQVMLDDLFQDLRRAGVIPDAIRIDHRDGTVLADAQAIDLAAVNQRLWADQVELFETRLQEFPRDERL